jgi:hypothetical protein
MFQGLGVEVKTRTLKTAGMRPPSNVCGIRHMTDRQRSTKERPKFSCPAPRIDFRKKHAVFPWIAQLKVCPAAAKEVVLLTEEQTRICEENFK